MVRAHALTESELLEIDVATLRSIVQTDTELSETLSAGLRAPSSDAYRQALGALVLIGSRFSADSLRLKEFLARNGQPYTYFEVERDSSVQAMLEHFGISPQDVPVLVCHNRPALRNPSK